MNLTPRVKEPTTLTKRSFTNKTNQTNMNTINSNIRLLSPDAAESDPLAQDVGEEIKYPLLTEKLIQFEIRKPVRAPSKSSGNDMLTVPCYTMQDERSTDGDLLRAGFRVTHRVMLSETADRTGKQIANDIKLLCQATGITGKQVKDIIADPSILDGKTMQATVKVNEAKGEFGASNSLRPMPIG